MVTADSREPSRSPRGPSRDRFEASRRPVPEYLGRLSGRGPGDGRRNSPRPQLRSGSRDRLDSRTGPLYGVYSWLSARYPSDITGRYILVDSDRYSSSPPDPGARRTERRSVSLDAVRPVSIVPLTPVRTVRRRGGSSATTPENHVVDATTAVPCPTGFCRRHGSRIGPSPASDPFGKPCLERLRSTARPIPTPMDDAIDTDPIEGRDRNRRRWRLSTRVGEKVK